MRRRHTPRCDVRGRGPAVLATPLLLVLAINANGQDAWIPGPAIPTARAGTAMIYDSDRELVVLFGGTTSPRVTTNDTWEFDGTNWVDVSPAVGPSVRSAHRMAYDSERSEVVLFGGADRSGQLGETWTFDGANWVRHDVTPSPSDRGWHSLAFDPIRRVTVLFGGYDAQGQSLNDTWEWDGAAWTQRFPSVAPSKRHSHNVVFDSARGEIVLFGGKGDAGEKFEDTWTYRAGAWTQRLPATSPSARDGHAMAYDPYRQNTILFDGDGVPATTPLSDSWTWDGSTWTRSQPPLEPPGRWGAGSAFDAKRRRFVVFGGSNLTGTRLGDTWERLLRPVANYDTIGTGCAGSSGMPPTLSSSSVPILGQPFAFQLDDGATSSVGAILFGAVETSLPLDPIGALGCVLYSSAEVSLGFATGPMGSWSGSVVIPNTSAFAGGVFVDQALVVDPPANPAGLVASNAGRATLGY